MKKELLFEYLYSLLRSELNPYLGSLHSFPQLLDGSLGYGPFLANHEVVIPKREAAAIAMLQTFSKKFIGTNKNKSLDDKAVLLFSQMNDRCKLQNEFVDRVRWNSSTPREHFIRDVLNSVSTRCLELVMDELASSPDLVLDGSGKNVMPIGGFDTGPGVTSTTFVGEKSSRLIHKKYAFQGLLKVSTERGVKTMQKLLHWHRPLSRLKMQLVRSDIVSLLGVPKSQKISRIIIPQNNGDLLLQYPMCSFFESILKRLGIFLETQQEKNRELARLGSHYDNRFDYNNNLAERHIRRSRMRHCTIDSSSASDLIGRRLCAWIFPYQVHNYMSDCQPEFAYYRDQDKNLHHFHLEMMANMGNAFCFPMQTIVFKLLADEICRRSGIKGNYCVAVYGDDIIIPYEAYNSMVSFMEDLYMLPNRQKSFSQGFFRESCGGDYYMGYDIRGVSVEALADDCDVYSLANRLIDWSTTHGIVIDKTIHCLLSLGLDRPLYLVPMSMGWDRGLRVPFSIFKKYRPLADNVVRLSYTEGSTSEGIFMFLSELRIKTVQKQPKLVPLTPHEACMLGMQPMWYLRGSYTQRKLSKKMSKAYSLSTIMGGLRKVDPEKFLDTDLWPFCHDEGKLRAGVVIESYPFWDDLCVNARGAINVRYNDVSVTLITRTLHRILSMRVMRYTSTPT